jgi:hypothetical protein
MKRLTLAQSYSEDEDDFAFSLNDKVALAKLEWEGDDEFRLNGNMYDVIEKKIESNQLIIRALADKKETSLLKKYSDINDGHSSNNKTAVLIKLVSDTYVSPSGTILVSDKKKRVFMISFQPTIISSNANDVLTPPPQAC